MGNVIGESLVDGVDVSQAGGGGPLASINDEGASSDEAIGQMCDDNHVSISIIGKGESSTTCLKTTLESQTLNFTVQLDNPMTSGSSNNSFPLSESELPESFDASFSPADISDIFANVAPKVNQDSPDRQEAATSMPEHEVEATSDQPCSHRESYAHTSHAKSTVAEQFSQLESTMKDILPSSVATNRAATQQGLTIDRDVVVSSNAEVSSSFELSKQAATDIFQPVEKDTKDHRVPENHLPKGLPLHVTTYADATNLAIKYPELAEEILTLPLPKPYKPASTSGTVRSLSPSLHHPDRPNWAAAPDEVASATRSEDTADYIGTETRRSRRRRGRSGNNRGSSQRNRRGGLDSRSDPRDLIDGRHDPPPHRRGAREHNQHADGIPLFERLSDFSNEGTNTSGGGGDDTGTSINQTQECGWEAAGAISRDAPSVIPSFGHSDVGADSEGRNEWDITHANSWQSVPDATDSPHDETCQQVPPNLAANRLGRHIISSRTIDTNSEQKRRVFRQAHRQQVSDLNIATRRYLGEVVDRERRKTSSRASPNRSVEIRENPDESLEERFHRLSSSHSIHSHRGTAEEVTTPRIFPDESPFRDIQIRTINSPKIAQAPHSYSSSNKSPMHPAVASVKSQENQPVSIHYHEQVNEWLPVQHTADDWLPPTTPDPFQLAPSRVLYPTTISDPYFPTDPIPNSNHRTNRNTNPSNSFRTDSSTNHTASADWFAEPPAQLSSSNINSGPTSDAKQSLYAGRARQSLPTQTDAFSQHMAETYPSSNFGRVGRGWRAGGRGATRASPAQFAQPRRNPYGPRSTESIDGTREARNNTDNWRSARV